MGANEKVALPFKGHVVIHYNQPDIQYIKRKFNIKKVFLFNRKFPSRFEETIKKFVDVEKSKKKWEELLSYKHSTLAYLLKHARGKEKQFIINLFKAAVVESTLKEQFSLKEKLKEEFFPTNILKEINELSLSAGCGWDKRCINSDINSIKKYAAVILSIIGETLTVEEFKNLLRKVKSQQPLPLISIVAVGYELFDPLREQLIKEVERVRKSFEKYRLGWWNHIPFLKRDEEEINSTIV